MVQSPSWEANWFAASQDIPRISRNPKVHYRTHKRPPPVSILGQPNPVHILTSHLLEINPNIIHPSRPRSPQWSLSVRFPHQEPIHPLSSSIRATCPAHLILLDFIARTILGEEYGPNLTPIQNIKDNGDFVHRLRSSAMWYCVFWKMGIKAWKLLSGYQSFIYSPSDALVSCLKNILKFTLKQLRHVSVLQLHHHQGAVLM